MDIPVVRNILEANDRISEQLKKLFAQAGVFVPNLISSPGAGKTTLLEKTLTALQGEFRMGVIEGDLMTDNDARRVAATGAKAVQINTEGGCHLDGSMVLSALESFDLSELDILFIENVGNLVCPVEFEVGEDCKVALLSVTEGDDKPEKYPLLFAESKAMVLNKVDLLPYVDFDVEVADKHSRALNKDLEIFHVSARSNEGMDAWLDWLRAQVAAKKNG